MKKVYIGDPCYLINKDVVSDDWFDFCDVVDNIDSGKIIDYKSCKMFVMKAKNGDGVYEFKDKSGRVIRDLFVDSGLLCVFDVGSFKNGDLDLSYGIVLYIDEFDDKNVYLGDDSAIFHIGDYICDTSYYGSYIGSYEEEHDIIND